jgi:hypothetical protein
MALVTYDWTQMKKTWVGSETYEQICCGMQGYPYTRATIKCVVSAVSHVCLQTATDDNDVSVVRLETALADGHILVRRVVSCMFICEHCSVYVLRCICILQRLQFK